MMKIARKRKVKINGVEAEIESCTRGAFLTESSMRDGGKDRKLVVKLDGYGLTIRYARSKRVLVTIGYDEIVRRQRAATWKIGPRARKN